MASSPGKEALLRELAVAIETIVLAKEEGLSENLEEEEGENAGKVVEGGDEGETRDGLRRRRRRTRGRKSDGGDADAREESMQRVLDIVQHVLKDGSMMTDFLGREECRTFVLGNQGGGGSVDLFGSANIEGWLQLQLSKKALTHKLRDLYSQKKRVKDHYSPCSISRDPVLRQTFLLCLEALEHEDLGRLTALNLRTPHYKSKRMRHRLKRSSSAAQKTSPRSKQLDLPDLAREDKRLPAGMEENGSQLQRTFSLPELSPICETPGRRRGSVDYCNSSRLPRLRGIGKVEVEEVGREEEQGEENQEERRQQTVDMSMDAFEQEQLKKLQGRGHRRGASDTSTIDFSGRGEDETDSRDITGSWTQVVPATTGWFPRPRANQSLIAFLAESGGDSVKKGRRAQLDRENAHFILSEAMISTFEQMNFERKMQELEEEGGAESDEEIRELKRRLKMRRSELKESARSRNIVGILSDGQTDTTTTDQSASPAYSSPGEEGETDRMLDSGDEEFSGWEQRGVELPGGSAESIALSLLSRVGSGRLPPADQLTWLVSRDEVDQDLLPLPSSLPVDPEFSSDLQDATELRGTLTWAPPRPQIVLTVQEKPRKKLTAMMAQKMMCAGCGMKVEAKYHKSFRFCNYLGRYFCTGCHENQGAIIPARVIYHWDFKKYPVSNFSLDILHSMVKEPVFNIHEQNPTILRKIEKLKQVALARTQLSKLSRYVSNCRLAPELHANIEACLVSDNEMYSLDDLCNTRSGALGPALRSIISQGLAHVKGCHLCQARAFICEGCHSKQPVFPFQMNVLECPECGSCYHKSCYSIKSGCVKCHRKQLRQQLEPAVC